MKISNQTLWAKGKIGSLKTFHFPHSKYQFPKGGEQNHPSFKVCRNTKKGFFTIDNVSIFKKRRKKRLGV